MNRKTKIKGILLLVFLSACLGVVFVSGISDFMKSSNQAVDGTLRQISIRLKTPPAHNCFVFQNKTDSSRANHESLPQAECFRATNDLLFVRDDGKRAIFLIPDQGEDLKLEKVSVLLNALMVGKFWYLKLPKSDEIFALYPDKTFVFDDEGYSLEFSQHLTALESDDLAWKHALVNSKGKKIHVLPQSFFDALESFEQTQAQFKIFPRP